jgi:hypothetical protein
MQNIFSEMLCRDTAYRHLSDVHTSGVQKSLSKGNIIFYFFPAYTKNFRPVEQNSALVVKGLILKIITETLL